MRLPGFDVIFGLAAPAIIIFVKPAGVTLLQICDDEARVGPLRAGLDAGDNALDAAPARGPVVKLFVTAHLAILRRGLVAGFHAGLETADVALQCRGWRHAEDVIEAVGATKVENLGAAIMTVGAQHDFGPRPVGADGAQQAAQDGHDLLAAWPFGRTQHGGDETARAVEHDDRLKAVFIVMRVEQTQLLAAMHRVERVVEIERYAPGNLVKRLAIRSEEH